MESSWAWWKEKVTGLDVRHAARVLHIGAALERVVLGGGPPLDRALQTHQRAHPSMGRNDRLVLGTAVYGLARNRETIRSVLPDAAEGRGDLLGMALLDALGAAPELLFKEEGARDRFGRALHDLETARTRCVSMLARAGAQPVRSASGPLRRALTELFSVPVWWLEDGPWETVGEAVQELARLRTPQKLCLRVQTFRRSREEVLRELAALGIPAEPTEFSPWGLVVQGRQNVLGTALYREGIVEVQDEGSQLTACLCDPRPDERVLDLCAGAGGKSLALGSMMRGRGSIVAYDVDSRRLARAKERARRAGLGNIRAVSSREEVERLGPYDVILVDAPCSSSGTLRRNPDVAWRWQPESVRQLESTQATVLGWASSLVRPGKFLVYVTCSLLKTENEAQVHRFLARYPQFALCPPGDRRAHQSLLQIPGASTGAFRLPANLPRYRGDAFFLSRFRRAS